MIWLFLSVVLVLAVLHPGFRRVAGWIAAVGVVLAAIGVYKFTHPTPDPCPWKPSVLAGTDECGAANPHPYVNPAPANQPK